MIIAFKSLGQNKGTMQTYIERQWFQLEKSFDLLIAYDVLSGSAESAAVRSNRVFFLLLSRNAAATEVRDDSP